MELASICKQLGVLPRAGGILDQDHYHVILIRAALNAIAAKEEKDIQDSQREAEARAKARR